MSDLNSKIPVIIEPKGIQSILSGSGEDIGVIQYTRNENLVENNSIIYTSGSGGLFKSGIPIGRINNSTVSAEQKVNFFSDFSQLNFVKIISFKSEDAK